MGCGAAADAFECHRFLSVLLVDLVEPLEEQCPDVAGAAQVVCLHERVVGSGVPVARFPVQRTDVKVLGGGEHLGELARQVVDGLPELRVVEQRLLCWIEALVVTELSGLVEPVHHFAGHGEISGSPFGHDDNTALPRVFDEVPHFFERIGFTAVGVALRERVLAERRAEHPEHLVIAGVQSERVEFELAAQIHALFDL